VIGRKDGAALILPGEMGGFRVRKGERTVVEWGAPLELDFSLAGDDDGLHVSGVRLSGARGERYLSSEVMKRGYRIFVRRVTLRKLPPIEVTVKRETREPKHGEPPPQPTPGTLPPRPPQTIGISGGIGGSLQFSFSGTTGGLSGGLPQPGPAPAGGGTKGLIEREPYEEKLALARETIRCAPWGESAAFHWRPPREGL